MNRMKWLVTAVAVVSMAVFSGGCKTKKAAAGYNSGLGDLAPITDGMEMGLTPNWETAQGIPGLFAPVYFDYDSAQIKESERAKADAVVQAMKSGTYAGVIIEGHCDERGSNEYNLALGERRAIAVRNYFMTLGIDGARINTRSYGEERPVCMESNEACWSQNRRADFLMVK